MEVAGKKLRLAGRFGLTKNQGAPIPAGGASTFFSLPTVPTFPLLSAQAFRAIAPMGILSAAVPFMTINDAALVLVVDPAGADVFLYQMALSYVPPTPLVQATIARFQTPIIFNSDLASLIPPGTPFGNVGLDIQGFAANSDAAVHDVGIFVQSIIEVYDVISHA